MKGLGTAALRSGTLSPSLLLTDDNVHFATHKYSNLAHLYPCKLFHTAFFHALYPLGYIFFRLLSCSQGSYVCPPSRMFLNSISMYSLLTNPLKKKEAFFTLQVKGSSTPSDALKYYICTCIRVAAVFFLDLSLCIFSHKFNKNIFSQ